MLLALLATILILAIASYQVVQGLFSALVMTILSILAVMVAFNYYELLAPLLYPYQPLHADGLVLVVLFGVSLMVFRVLYDKFIPGNVVFGMWLNRIGGGVLGILTGSIMVGMLLIAVQMLPFQEKFLTYRPFDGSLGRSSRLAPFYADEFTLGMAKMLSAGSFQTTPPGPLGGEHGDLLLEAFCTRNRAALGGELRVKTDSLASAEAYEPDPAMFRAFVDDIPRNPLLGQNAVGKILIVRATVKDSAADSDRWWRLPGTHFRLVGSTGRSYYPVAYLISGVKRQVVAPALEDGTAQLANLAVQRPTQKAKTLTLDWIYEIPATEKPASLVFRRVASKKLSAPSPSLPLMADGLKPNTDSRGRRGR